MALSLLHFIGWCHIENQNSAEFSIGTALAGYSQNNEACKQEISELSS